MTDCKGVCAPICHAWPYCWAMTLNCTVCSFSDCSLLSCQASYILFQFFLNIYFPFLCKQVFVLHAGCLIAPWISRALWNSVHFLYYRWLCVWRLMRHSWDIVLLLLLSWMQSQLTHIWRINRKLLSIYTAYLYEHCISRTAVKW